jgi:dipeptidase D
MENPFDQLKPERLWQYFLEICQVPRPSKKEERIADYLTAFAERQKLEVITDVAGNVLIRKPASAGYEERPAVILQSHLDMVCEKNSDKVFDFDKDAIEPWVDGNWVKARGTTLGADDGIGIAAAMAILEAKDIPHPAIEALFTVDEETGLTGAFALTPDLLKGRILINLDSEDEGQLFIGCAGGKDTVATLNLSTEAVQPGCEAFEVSVTGLKGGHSGDDINKGLGNAVKLLNRFLWNASKDFGARISSIDAGNLRNALAREGFAIVTVPKDKSRTFLSYASEYQRILVDELQHKILDSLYACPHGVIAMSREIPNFVETSTNLASVKIKDDKVFITTSQRSSVESSKKDVADMVHSLFAMAGAEVEHSTGYPGWKPNPDSQILRITVDSYKRLFKEDPQVLAIHAGLECGLVGAIYPGMDMVSFGPTIKGAHSPDERLDIATVTKFWELTLDVLKNA